MTCRHNEYISYKWGGHVVYTNVTCKLKKRQQYENIPICVEPEEMELDNS